MAQVPAIGTEKSAAYRKVLATLQGALFLPGGKIIDGSKSRDFGNTGDLDTLRAGLLMGKITASGKYAPSILGIVTDDNAASDTSITVGVAEAVEIDRRIGQSGTITIVNVAGDAAFTETFSAVDTTTGVITVSALDSAVNTGSLIFGNDGTENPVTIITNESGIKVTDKDGNNIDVQFEKVLVSGLIDASQIISYPSDADLVSWLKGKLRANGIGFVFDDDF